MLGGLESWRYIFSLFQLLLLWCAFFRVTPFSNPFTHLAFSYWILIVSFWLLTMRELSSWTENAKYDDQWGRGIFLSQRNNWPMKSELSASALFLNRVKFPSISFDCILQNGTVCVTGNLESPAFWRMPDNFRHSRECLVSQAFSTMPKIWSVIVEVDWIFLAI